MSQVQNLPKNKILGIYPKTLNRKPIKGFQKGDSRASFSLEDTHCHTPHFLIISFLPCFSETYSHSQAGGAGGTKPPFDSIIGAQPKATPQSPAFRIPKNVLDQERVQGLIRSYHWH